MELSWVVGLSRIESPRELPRVRISHHLHVRVARGADGRRHRERVERRRRRHPELKDGADLDDEEARARTSAASHPGTPSPPGRPTAGGVGRRLRMSACRTKQRARSSSPTRGAARSRSSSASALSVRSLVEPRSRRVDEFLRRATVRLGSATVLSIARPDDCARVGAGGADAARVRPIAVTENSTEESAVRGGGSPAQSVALGGSAAIRSVRRGTSARATSDCAGRDGGGRRDGRELSQLSSRSAAPRQSAPSPTRRAGGGLVRGAGRSTAAASRGRRADGLRAAPPLRDAAVGAERHLRRSGRALHNSSRCGASSERKLSSRGPQTLEQRRHPAARLRLSPSS